jgi:antigen flippase
LVRINTETLTEPVGNSLTQKENSYDQIVKSSSIIGGAQIINMGIGLIRTKVVAVLIGPSGIGLIAIYQSIVELASTIAGLGINTSGVRVVAQSYGKSDVQNLAKTVRNLRRISWFTGIAGMLLLAGLSPWISQLSFGSKDYAWAITTLGVTILFSNITGSQAAFIQGTRRIGDIAQMSVWGSLIGTILSVCMYWAFGVEGIIPALVGLSFVTFVVSSYYARNITLEETVPTWSETWKQSRVLIEFGIAMIISGVMGAGVAYATRVLITHQSNIDGLGIYSAAFGISGMLVQFVLGAMGADFYPRLAAKSNDHPGMIKLINEQTEVGLLLAFPGIMATLVFSPLIISILYTREFSESALLLRWFIIGCLGRIISWPLGFSLLAKGQTSLFVMTEIAFNLLHLGLIWMGLQTMGLQGTAAAFAILYVAYAAIILTINRMTIDFCWSSRVRTLLAWMLPVCIVNFAISLLLPQTAAILVGCLLTFTSSIVCLRQLAARLDPAHRISKFGNIFRTNLL